MSSTKSNSWQWFTVISTPTYNNEWNEFDKKQQSAVVHGDINTPNDAEAGFTKRI